MGPCVQKIDTLGVPNMAGDAPDDAPYHLRRAYPFVWFDIRADEDDVHSDEQPAQPQGFSVELSPPREMIRARPPPPVRVAHAGGKRPAHTWRDLYGPDIEDDDSDMEQGQVDLKSYFEELGVTPKEQVLLCRSHASYVAACLRAKKRIKIKELKP